MVDYDEPMQIGDLSYAPDTEGGHPPPAPPATPPVLGYAGGSENPDVTETLTNTNWMRLLGEAAGAATLGGAIGWTVDRPKRGWTGARRGAYAGLFLWSGADVVRSFSTRHWSISLAFIALMIPSGVLLYREVR